MALRHLIDRGMSLFDARAPFTSNVTDVLEPYRNGRLKAEMDGDLVVLDENLAVRHVMAGGGEQHVREGQIARRGMHEQFKASARSPVTARFSTGR
ncbi:hypothetical protein [Ruegeria sp. HKCCA0370]|uniref:hypothetical protein n=2 Tax=unclassified Ruegeria TaxID=2625375 RepID=UPI001488567C|nr:hypothetical protein [Ruegeria sp. HKCCA0370]